jgi:DNA modification methylase
LLETNKIYNMDCLDGLQLLDDNSIDSIVTDPPYELGFMNKKWDSTGISYNVQLWEECLRVLKPGGHLLAFGGTRTYHRMACAIEDAGFEIRDCIQWIYGCLSEDTEILTLNGWERYHKAIEESPVICYNIDKDTFELHKPERSFIYENKHPAYRIKSDFTDQIVSRNHRCIVERGGRKVFAYAETLERQESVPFLESLHDLPETIPYPHEGTSITKQDLLQRVRLQEYQQKQERESNPSGAMRREGVDNLPRMWEGSLEVPKDVKEGGNTHLQQTVQRGFEGGGMEETRPQREGELDEGVGAKVSRAYDGGEQPSLEGRSDVLQKEGQLYGGEVCTMPRAVPADGKERWLYYGTSVDRSTTLGENVEADRSSTSYRSRSDQQRSCESYVVSEQQCPQEVRSYGKTRTTLATVEEVEYAGKMWCVQVPTGAFVARRNGQIFITGNSGFPKSHDISKAIDKKLGAKREVIGKSARNDRVLPSGQGGYHGNIQDTYRNKGRQKVQLEITAPATPEAKQWNGWGTALKPANEPIVLARKPLSEKTIAENVMKWGTGGLNIDGCRVGNEELVYSPKGIRPGQGNYVGDNYKPNNPNTTVQGRFPANVILDEEAGKLLDEQSGILKSGALKPYQENHQNASSYKMNRYKTFVQPANEGGASRFFYCAKASKKERGEGNNHPTVKPLSLIKYLITLVTPPGGICLDPFEGSGTHTLACKELGFKYIGFEMNEDYMQIIESRLDKQQGFLSE